VVGSPEACTTWDSSFSDGATPTGMALVDHQVTGTSIHSFRPTGPIIQSNHKVEASIDVAH
jgi:hypothetical protein